jgi:hypothetical protein
VGDNHQTNHAAGTIKCIQRPFLNTPDMTWVTLFTLL